MPISLWILNHYAISPDMPGAPGILIWPSLLKGHDVTIFASGFDHLAHVDIQRLSPKKNKG